jgi:hypothetical protein
MDRPNLTPEQQDIEPKERPIADIIVERYPVFAVVSGDSEASIPPHFIVDKGNEVAPLSLEKAIQITVHYESTGTNRDVLFDMLDGWYRNAKQAYEVTSVDPNAKAQIEALRESTRARIAEYVMELGK